MSSGKSVPFGDYKLEFNFNAICEAEEILGPLPALVKDRKAFEAAKTVRALLWAMMLEHHPDITLKQAGTIIEEVGLDKADAAVQSAFVKAYPDAFNDDGSPKKKQT